MTKLAVSIINFYQKTLSPDHSFWAKKKFPAGYCRFYPSCSEYTKQAILEFGFLRGAEKGFFRILRCNPFSAPNIDPIK